MPAPSPSSPRAARREASGDQAHPRRRGARTAARRAPRPPRRAALRGYRVPSGEIDIIARRFGVVAAIEVKARATLTEAGEAVAPRQRRRVARAFEHFLAGHGALAGLVQRFDVMLVTPGRLPCHLRNAWRIGE
jgi:putative endonuclease